MSYSVQHNLQLRPFNTFGIRATAHLACTLDDEAAVDEVLGLLREKGAAEVHAPPPHEIRPNEQPFPRPLILSGGSNLLLARDLDEPVLLMRTRGRHVVEQQGDTVWLDVAAGEVAWDGRSMVCVPVHKRGFGLMFQDGQLFEHRDVGSNIAYGLTDLPRAQRSERVREMLELVGLPGFERRRVTTLSGGQAQRVAMARALASSPSVVFADEPTGALDQATGHEIMQILTTTARMSGATLVVVTHDPNVAAWCDRLIEIRDGRIHADTTAKGVRS